MRFCAIRQPCDDKWCMPTAQVTPLVIPVRVPLVVRLVTVLFEIDQPVARTEEDKAVNTPLTELLPVPLARKF